MENSPKILIVDGKMINLDKTSIEDLKKVQKNLQEREREIRKQIEKELNQF